MQSQAEEQKITVDEENNDKQQFRCRICYLDSLPLISLCQCSGSIAFVHEQCILDWIKQKMELYEHLALPYCEICKKEYSANFRIGKKSLCTSTLLLKIRLLSAYQKFLSIYFLVGIFFSFFLMTKTFMQIFSLILQSIFNSDMSFYTQQLRQKPFETIFTKLTLPIYFNKEAFAYLKKFKMIIQQSMIQVLQFRIQPKMIIK